MPPGAVQRVPSVEDLLAAIDEEEEANAAQYANKDIISGEKDRMRERQRRSLVRHMWTWAVVFVAGRVLAGMPQG